MTDEVCPRFSPGPWTFDGRCDWDKREDHCCNYCGSLHPDIVMARIEAGTVLLGATDKSYKLYVSNNGGEDFKQTYRNCPRDSGCKGPEDCTHWVTRPMRTHKFYFQHLSVEQRKRFVELYNERKLKMEGGYDFYVLPFFMVRVPKSE